MSRRVREGGVVDSDAVVGVIRSSPGYAVAFVSARLRDGTVAALSESGDQDAWISTAVETVVAAYLFSASSATANKSRPITRCGCLEG